MNLAWLVVAALYLLGVAIARRAGADLPKRVAALFLVLTFAFLWRPLTQNVVIVPADVLKLVEPWSGMRAPGRPPVTKYDVSNLNLHDVPMQIVPWMQQVRESWRRGEVPLWNEAVGCGMPLMANGQSTPFSPFVLLTLPLPLGFAITAQCALKLLLALTLTYVFCRRRWSLLASILAAIAYGFSTWMLVWLQFPIATAAALLPGVILAIELLMERKAFAFPVFVFVITVLSGHPETIFNLGLIAALHGLWIANARGLLRVIAACAVAAIITAPYLVPFYEAVTRSQRFAEMHAPREMTPPFSDRASATLLVQPRFFGELPIERPWGPATLESVCGFAGVLALASLVAAFFVIRKARSIETLYVLGAIVCFGIVLGWPVITQGFHAIAGLAPAMRMRLGIVWFASILIAPVIDHPRRWPLLLGALTVSLTLFALMRTTPFPSASHAASAVLSLLPSLAVLVAIALSAFRKEMLVAAGALTFLELGLAMSTWNPIVAMREFNPRPRSLPPADGLHRIVGIGGQLYPNTNALFGLDDVRVHDPMAFAPYVELLSQRAGWTVSDYYAKWTDANSPLLDRLNVKFIVAADGQILENPGARERFYSDHANVRITRISGTEYRLHITAKGHALIASSIANYPGWTAGKFPVFAHDGPFVAFLVPPGTHDVTVKYRPRSFYWPLIPSVLATVFVLGGRPRDRRRR